MMDQLTLAPNAIDAFWAKVDERIDRRIAQALTEFGKNHRPRGKSSVAITDGSRGTPLTASLTTPGEFVKVPYPIHLEECHMVVDATGSVTVDIWVQRPSDTPATAASIVGATLPAIVSAREVIIVPATAGWTTDYLEPGSIVSVYITAVDGVIQIITVNLGSRNV